MTKPPVIGILTNLLTVDTGRFIGMERSYVNRDYVDCIIRSRGIPFLLPIIEDVSLAKEQVALVDAILFSGGQDVHPHLYGEEPSPFLEITHKGRDTYELAVLTAAFSLKKPILGICRGLQLINVALGGTLYQDLKNHFPSPALTHNQESPRQDPIHTVQIEPTSRLFSIFQTESVETNSFHHQAVKDLAPSLRVSARSSDGVVEAVENLDILAVQWHPEMMAVDHPLMQKLFDDLIERANR